MTAKPPNPDRVTTSTPLPRHRPVHKGGIDISTGLYIREDDDLVVNTALPIVLRRTYLSGDHISRQYGVGATHPGEWWIYGDSDPRVLWGELIRPDGSRIHFRRISPGDTQKGAVLRYDGTPAEFDGALLSWNGSTWDMRFRDGSLAVFSDCHYKTDTCALLERRSSDGHRIAYVRNAAKTLLRMESEGQSIAFEYDEHKRIVRAFDTARRVVTYTYDPRGRLVRTASSEGTLRHYGYDDRHQLVSVREPERIVQNWFDDSGRVVRQEVRHSDDDDDPYVATVRCLVENGTVVQTDFDEGNGIERSRYNRDHHVVSEIFGADSAAPITFTYSRDDTNVVNGVTLSCLGVGGLVTRSLPLSAPQDDPIKAAHVRETCLVRP